MKTVADIILVVLMAADLGNWIVTPTGSAIQQAAIAAQSAAFAVIVYAVWRVITRNRKND